MGATKFDDTTEKQLREIVRRGISSFKIFLAYKGAFGIDDAELYHTLKLAKELGVIVTAHCENETLVAERQKELLAAGKNAVAFKDFAHAPSKVKATISAMKEQYPDRKLIACLELHTYSSLSQDFLPQYEGVMEMADVKIVYFNPHALALKKLPALADEQIINAFKSDGLIVFSDSRKLEIYLRSLSWEMTNLLLMSSGNFDGMNFADLASLVVADK